MKLFIKFSLFIFIFSFFVSTLSYAKEFSYLKKDENNYLKSNNILNVYVEPDIYFYSYTYGNNVNGYAVGYLRKIAKMLHIKFNLITDISVEEAKRRLKNGNIDIALFASSPNVNTEHFLFSKVHIGILKPSLLLPKIYQLPPTLDSIEEMSIVVVKRQNFASIIRKRYPDFDVIEVDTVEEAVSKVEKQEVDAAAGLHEVFRSHIEYNMLSSLESIPLKDKLTFPSIKMYLRTSRSNQMLMSIIDKTMATLNYHQHSFLRNQFFLSSELHQTKITVPLSKKEKFFLIKKQSLNVCTIPKKMPYGDVTRGEYKGIGADMSFILQNSLDTPIDILPTVSKKDTIEKLISGECDFLSVVPNTISSNELLKYSSTLFEVPLVLLTTNDYLYEGDFKSISNRSFLIQKNHPMKDSIYKKFPKINLTEVGSDIDGVKLVEKGEYFGLITSRLRVSYIFRNHIADNLKISSQLPLTMNFGFALLKENKLLYEVLEKAISSTLSKEVESSIKSWVSERYPKGFDYTIVLQLVIIFVIFSAITFGQHFEVSLKNQRLEDTKESLAKLNKNLENLVQTEVQNSRKKDTLMYRQSRYASMGEMIGNIAHQWRQPLMHLSSLLMELQATTKFNKKVDKEYITEIVSSSNVVIKFMSETIDDFRNFFVPQKESDEFSINKVIVDAVNIMSSALKHHKITIDVDEKSYDSVAYGNKNEYAQVIINLLSNSKDMLITRNINNGKILIKIEEDEKYSKVLVIDNAGGIENDDFNIIFEPFFTKNKPNGTGVGLFMSRMIIENHMKGIITAGNIENGAVFYVNVPKLNIK